MKSLIEPYGIGKQNRWATSSDLTGRCVTPHKDESRKGEQGEWTEVCCLILSGNTMTIICYEIKRIAEDQEESRRLTDTGPASKVDHLIWRRMPYSRWTWVDRNAKHCPHITRIVANKKQKTRVHVSHFIGQLFITEFHWRFTLEVPPVASVRSDTGELNLTDVWKGSVFLDQNL